MDWKRANKNNQGFLSIPKRWLHLHYYEALNILFRFENSLRVFVYVVLKNDLFDRWLDCNLSSAGSDQKSIKGIAAKRINQADNFGYLGFDIKAPLMHLTSGELVELITADAYWPKFRNYFKGNRDIIKNKLLEIGTIRNSLAHFRPMKAEDIEVVKQNSRHTLLGVEQCLASVFTQSLRVPTNTSESWYKSLSTLGTNQITTTLHYSTDEQWVNVRLAFKSPILEKEKHWENFYSYRLGKINSPNILLNHMQIKKHVIYLSESNSYPVLTDGYDIDITKSLNFVFGKSTIVANGTAIAEEFTDVLAKINEECELLKQDNLARGSIVETASGTSWWQENEEGRESRWNHNYADLAQPYRCDDPDEYWGLHQYTTDVVAGCRRYPWMPDDISDHEGFMD